jgi:cell division inhibitor SepF
MTALHRVKAYFGMVPADELDSYDGYGEYGAYADTDRPARGSDRYDADRYDADRHDSDRYARRPRHDRYDADRYDVDRYDEGRHDTDRADRHAGDRYGSDRFGEGRHDDDRYEDRHDAARHDRFDADRHERTGRAESTARTEDRARTPRPRDPEPEVRPDLPRLGADHDRTGSGDRDEEADVSVRSSARGRSWEHNTGPNHTSRSGRSGSLASVGSSSGSSSSLSGSLSASGAAALALDEPVRRPSERPERGERADVSAVPDTPAVPEITTLQPTSYNEARVIGERYRDGIPVIMNLTEMDDVAAKRLVDFAAGLAFALRGSIEKVTNRVFLLSPPNVEVSATDRRKLAEKSFSTAP